MRNYTIPLFFAVAAVCPGQTDRIPLENDQVRVLRALEKPHVKGRPHKHDVNRVMVYLQSGTQEFGDEKGEKKTTLKYKAKEVIWSPATAIHIPELITDEPVNIIEVELKKPGSGKSATGPLDPVKVDSKHYKVEFENDQTRVVHVKFGPHEKAPMHEHMLNRVVVYLTDQNIQVTGADGKAETVVHKATEVSWGQPAKHREENLNNGPFEAVIVELK